VFGRKVLTVNRRWRIGFIAVHALAQRPVAGAAAAVPVGAGGSSEHCQGGA
jgi:hypothetical protein